MKSIPCRVCGGRAHECFSKFILGRLTVSYHQCGVCGHVQSEQPYWLGESYGQAEWNRDVGLVSRLLDTFHLTFALAWRERVSPDDVCVDFGGGTGLLARLCRDYGLNFHNFDPYADDLFAHGFNIRQMIPAKMVTAFEVVEHFPDPVSDFQKIFAFDPEMVFFSTRLYEGQSAEWWYFLENGQHIAVYTKQSLELIARRFGYHFYSDFDFHLFSKKVHKARIVKKLRGYRDKFPLAYRKRHGSKIEADVRTVFGTTTADVPRSAARATS